MIIGIDLLPLKTGSYQRGIGNYSAELVRALLRLDPVNQYHLFNVPLALQHLFSGCNVTRYEEKASGDALSTLDAFLILNYFELFEEIPYLPCEIPCRSFLLVHDLIGVIFWEKTLVVKERRLEYFSRLIHVRNFDLIFANSKSTMRNVTHLLDIPRKKTRVVYAGLDEGYLQPASGETALGKVRERYAIKKSYILSILSINFHKNISGLFEAFSILPPELRNNLCLVLVCRMSREEELTLRSIWAERALPDQDLVLTHYVEIQDLIPLYDGASLFCFPTLYEGFGLPILEAMARCCPVVTSTISASAEIAGNAAVLVDPYDPKAIAAGIRSVLEDDGLREHLVRAGKIRCSIFRWECVARRVLAEIEHPA